MSISQEHINQLVFRFTRIGLFLMNVLFLSFSLSAQSSDIFLAYDFQNIQIAHQQIKPISGKNILQSIHDAAAYLQKSVNKDGKFIYLQSLQHYPLRTNEYNILRHSGAIMAMAQYESKYGNGELIPGIKASSLFLKNNCLMPLRGFEDSLAIWSIPGISSSNSYHSVKLGGSALGLIAMLAAEDLLAGTFSNDTLTSLGNGILCFQKNKGKMHSKYLPDEGWDNNFQSLYYPGEAALALTILYEKDQNIKWLESSAKILGHLAQSRKNASKVPTDHWALLATRRLLKYSHKLKGEIVSFDLLIAHTIQICQQILRQADKHVSEIPLGCFTLDIQTTPTATRLEGLLAALEIIPKRSSNTQIREAIHQAIDLGIYFLRNSQIKSGPLTGGIPNRYFEEDLRKESVSKNLHIRIDYVQHSLSAFMQYEKLIRKEKLIQN